MKLVDLTCPSCGGQLHPDGHSNIVTCDFCGTKVCLDDESPYGTAANAEQAGYAFEKGRLRAQQEMNQQKSGNGSFNRSPDVVSQTPPQPKVVEKVVYVNQPQAPAKPQLKKSWLMFFLTLFLGWSGIQWFLSGRPKKGFLYLFTYGLFYFGWWYDVLQELIYCIKTTFLGQPQG